MTMNNADLASDKSQINGLNHTFGNQRTVVKLKKNGCDNAGIGGHMGKG